MAARQNSLLTQKEEELLGEIELMAHHLLFYKRQSGQKPSISLKHKDFKVFKAIVKKSADYAAMDRVGNIHHVSGMTYRGIEIREISKARPKYSKKDIVDMGL